MKQEIIKCDFCNKEIRDDDTYNHGACIEGLTYTIFFNVDYHEDCIPHDKVNFDICGACLSELRNCIWKNSKFAKLFSAHK